MGGTSDTGVDPRGAAARPIGEAAYNGTITTGIVLLRNPTTIGAGAYVTNTRLANIAVFGTSGTAWVLDNFGRIEEGGTPSGVGVDLLSGGLVTNEPGALIRGAQDSIVITGSAGTVANAGTIVGDVLLAAGGSLTNGVGSSGALIDATDGVTVGAGVGSVANFATIRGGVALIVGGSVYDGQGGVITAAAADAVVIASGSGIVVNLGTLAGAGGDRSGARLDAGGLVTNGSGYATAALIEGGRFGVLGGTAGGAGTVANLATIAASAADGIGVRLAAGGIVRNGASTVTGASISGPQQGVAVAGGAGLVVNYGTILSTAAGSSAIRFDAGGTAVNGAYSAYALIAGADHGVAMNGAAGTVVNFATITAGGSAGSGIYLRAGGIVTNYQTGLIVAPGYASSGIDIRNGAGSVLNYGTLTGNVGVYVGPTDTGRNTLVNAGTIIGYGGAAVLLAGGTGLLVVDPGAVFVGSVEGFGRAALELAAGAQTGTLFGLGSSFVGFDAVAVDAAASWRLSGATGGITNDGTIIVAGGDSLVLGRLGQHRGMHGVVAVEGGGTVEFTAGAAAAQRLRFVGVGDTVLLDDPAAFAARIGNFRAGDEIDLVGQTADALSYSAGKLTLTGPGGTVATLHFRGRYTATDFMLSPDGGGGTVLTLVPPATAQYEPFHAALEPAFAAAGPSFAPAPQQPSEPSPLWPMRVS